MAFFQSISIKTRIFAFLLALLGVLAQTTPSRAQTTVKKVVLQAYWWDFWNNNYPNSWANYLTELAPRLRSLGIDAVWIPPTIKNSGTNSVGYSPFDHYDLGDKFQKNSTTTRFGTKDELFVQKKRAHRMASSFFFRSLQPTDYFTLLMVEV